MMLLDDIGSDWEREGVREREREGEHERQERVRGRERGRERWVGERVGRGEGKKDSRTSHQEDSFCFLANITAQSLVSGSYNPNPSSKSPVYTPQNLQHLSFS